MTRHWKSLKDLPRSIWLLSASTFVNRLGSMALPFLVLYLTRQLGFPPGRAGLVLSLYGLGSLAAIPLAGALCDRLGAVRVLKLALALSAVCLLSYPIFKSFIHIAVATMLLAFGNESFRPACATLVGNLSQQSQRRSAYAVHRLATNLGMSIGPALGGLLARTSFPLLFVIDGATSLAALAMIAALSPLLTSAPAEPDETPPAETPGRERPRGPLSDRRMLYFLAAILPVGIVFIQFESTVPLYVVSGLHLSPATYGLTLTLNTLLVVALEIPLNSSMAGWSHRYTLSLGALLLGIGFGGLALAGGAVGVSLCVVTWTFGEMIVYPSLTSYVADLAPAERRGQYMGLFGMIFALAFAVGPSLGTSVLTRYGSNALWLSVLVLGLLSAVMLSRTEKQTGT